MKRHVGQRFQISDLESRISDLRSQVARELHAAGNLCGRRGWTLIELLLVITATTILSVTGATILCVLMAAERCGAETVIVERSLTRLALRLRSDLHAAEAAEVRSGDGAAAEFLDVQHSGGRRVRYACRPDEVTRDVFEGETVRERDGFRLPGGESRFEGVDDGAPLAFVHRRPQERLIETGGDRVQAAPLREVRIEAVVGWDRRFADAKGGASE
jgi:hypothetical protein